MLKDDVVLRGALRIVLTDASGSVKDTRMVENLVVTVGRNFIASRMIGTASSVMSHMALGTGSVAPVVGDTTLGTEIARVALTSATQTTNNIAYAATFSPGVGTGAITESGIFGAASAGTMLCRTVFGVITKGAADTLSITWTVSVN